MTSTGAVMRRLALSFGLLIAATTFSHAEDVAPAYKATDIVKFFAGKMQARAVCLDDECTAAEEKKPDAAFDLLVTFDFNSDKLTDSAKANLDEFAKALNTDLLKELSFAVEGHTDAKGSESYNLKLSQRRAAAVVAYLESKGVPTDKMVATGFGKQRPRVVEDPFDPVNRRVETRLRLEE